MSFGYTGGSTAGGTGVSAAITHGLTINAGDLVFAYLNLNGDDQVPTPDSDSGAGWTQVLLAAAGGPSGAQAIFTRVANGSEPSAYSWALDFSDRWRVTVKVFTCGAAPVVDSAVNTHLQVGSTATLVCGAANGRVISDNALSIICGGKDTAGAAEAYTLADNSYTGTVGNADNQASAVAHRIYTTGETFSGDITLTPADGTDNVSTVTYSAHISFVETGGGNEEAAVTGVASVPGIGALSIVATPPPPYTLTRVTG